MRPDVVNRDVFADLTGLSPSTVLRLIGRGMPAEKQPNGTWRIVCADAVAWMCDQARAKAARPLAEKEEGALELARTKLALRKLDLEEAQRQLVHISDVVEWVNRQFSVVRETIGTVPDRAMEKLTGPVDAAQARQIMKDAINDALIDLQERF